MPRFGAENIPNALSEQIHRDILRSLMGKDPMSGNNPFYQEYVQEFGDDPAIRDPEMQYGSINERVINERMQGRGNYDDSKTEAQRRRDKRSMEESYVYGKPEELNPLHRNNPPPFNTERADMPGNTPLGRAYNQLPLDLPRYPGMTMPPTDESQQMDQLMQFYTDENI